MKDSGVLFGMIKWFAVGALKGCLCLALLLAMIWAFQVIVDFVEDINGEPWAFGIAAGLVVALAVAAIYANAKDEYDRLNG